MSATTLPLANWDRPQTAEMPAPAIAVDLWPAPPPFMARRRHDLLSRTVAEEIVPRLVLARRGAALEPAALEVRYADDVSELADIVLQPGFDVASDRIDRISGRQPGTEAIYLDLLTPVARRLGEMWEEDLCDFVQVTVGLMRLQQMMSTLSVPFPQDAGRTQWIPRVLLVPAPSDQHSFGMSMVASFFQRAGWNGWSGVPASTDDLLSRVRNEWFGVVGFSVSNETRLDALTSVIRAIRRASRNREVGIMVGGPVFIEHPELVAMVGADATAVDGRQAVVQAQHLLSLIPSRG